MHLFKQLAVGDMDAAARMIPIIDYGPYFAGVPGALERLAIEVARCPAKSPVSKAANRRIFGPMNKVRRACRNSSVTLRQPPEITVR